MQDAASEAMSLALAPAHNISRDLTTRLRPYSNVLVKYTGQHQRRFEHGAALLQRVSTSEASCA